MSTKYILHGGYTRLENEHNYSFFRELVKDVPMNGSVLMCFFASGEEDKTSTYNELSNKLVNFSEGKQINLIFAEEESFPLDMKRADAIYFHGGSTRTLLKMLEKHTDLESYFQGKTVAGSSAGAYMLVKYGTAHNEDCAREGLGILNKKVVCHFQSFDMPPTETSLAQLELIAPELETIYLKDCEWRTILK